MVARESVHGADVGQLEAGDLLGGGRAAAGRERARVVPEGAVRCVFCVASFIRFPRAIVWPGLVSLCAGIQGEYYFARVFGAVLTVLNGVGGRGVFDVLNGEECLGTGRGMER